jgi:RND family efflux transporter MFP subunit
MKKAFAVGVVAFLAGAGALAFALANPVGWQWLSVATARLPIAAPAPAAPQAATAVRRVKYWRAPMDPTFVSDKPGKSPMGMDLIPVYEDEAEQAPPGTVRIDPVYRQDIGVQTESVTRRDIALNIRTVGTLAHNDKQIAWVNTKYEGWIENVAVNYMGENVTKGQALFDIYSPQLVTTEKEYLQALDYAARLQDSAYPDIAARARSLMDAARERLRYWDVTDAQIDELERTRTPRRTLSVISSVSGVVVAKMDQALDGMYVKPGMNIYKIADLSTIWVDVEIFENQVASMHVGQRATVVLPYLPGRTYTGYVRYLYPHFNEKTRTMTVSIEIQNPDQILRADMYATVTFDVPAARNVLAVPEEAVIRTGTRDLVIVERQPGTFQVVPVTLGANGSGVWEVKEGLEDGAHVVVSAQFLIDSESNLREAIRKVSGPPDISGGANQ